MKVRVDDDSCIGDETCVEIRPGIFEMKGDVAVIWYQSISLPQWLYFNRNSFSPVYSG